MVEFEQLITDVKWRIITLLSTRRLSPLQLAEVTKTSIANISQQLRLLEAAGLVRKEKVSNRERGKPRTRYFISRDILYVVVLSRALQEKGMVELGESQRQAVKKWLDAR